MLQSKIYFSRYCLFYLIYNFYVILGGAFVRATNSGAGCGAHWPLCEGQIIPDFSYFHTIIEFTHRASSGIVTIGAIILLTWSFACSEKAHPVRKSALVVFISIIIEALLGAALVLFKLVDQNSSNTRALFMALHLITTFILLASIILTFAWSSKIFTKPVNILKTHLLKKEIIAIIMSIIGLILVGSSGAITALADTIYPPLFIGENLLSDITYKNEFLKAVRIYHPIIAIIISFYISLLLLNQVKKTRIQIRLCYFILSLIIFQFFLGFTNIILLTPIFIQILHLFTADLIWVISILYFNEYLYLDE